MHPAPPASPLNPLPAVVWILALPLIAMEVVLSLGAAGIGGGGQGIGWRQEAAQRLAFAPDYLRAMWAEGYWPPDGVVRLVSYPLVHASPTHAIFVVVFLLALGKFAGAVFRPWALVALVAGSTAGAAVLYTLLPWVHAPLIGGYPPAYGLIGAFTFIRWRGLDGRGGRGAAAFSLIGMLLGVQLLFGALFGASEVWLAEIAGFACGFGLSILLAPGGPRRLARALRQR